VSGFVDECRSEWRRLGVPDPVANEMAAELAADLEEAAADGVSAEHVLGTGAFDACVFAREWAAERGLIRTSAHRPRTLVVSAATAAFALLAIVGGVLLVASSPSESRRLAVASVDGISRPAPAPEPALAPAPAPAPAPARATAPAPAPVMLSVDSDDSGFDARLPGFVLLAMGLAGVVVLTSFGLLRVARPPAA
jgi:hypothetical protein